MSTPLSCKNFYVVNHKYQFRLEVEDLEEKLYLCVYDLYGHLLEIKSFVYLQSILDRLMLNLKQLAIVYASQKEIQGEKCFRYYKICIYQFRGFDIF